MDLSVLIVSYRNPELTRACLVSVFEQTGGCDFEVIVVDNASGDGTPEMIESEFPAVRLVKSDTNLGFAAANNHAAGLARGNYLVLLNPDTVVLDGALQRLLWVARSRPAGIWGGRTVRPDGTLDPSSCWGRQSLWSAFCFATGLSTLAKRHSLLDPESLGAWARDTERRVGVVTGCLLLCAKADWQRLGGFDERFFMYGEDADLSERAHAAGLGVAITPEATIVHVVGASSAASDHKMVMVMRSRVTIMRKHWTPIRRVVGISLLMAGALLRAAGSHARRRARGGGPSFWEGVWRRRAEWSGGYAPPTARA